MVRWLVNALVASMIFFPTREYLAEPKDFGLIAEDVWAVTEDDIRIHGWYFAAAPSGQPPLGQAVPRQPRGTAADGEAGDKICLVVFHGNATNISGLLKHAKEWMGRGVSILLVDYRGYGASEGSIKKGTDIFLDAAASVDWLIQQKGLRRSQIVLYGQSVGSAPAIELATRDSYRALVLESAFSSLEELSKIHYGFSPSVFFRDFPYQNESKISKIKCPVFMIHGAEDEICPLWMGKRLFQNAPDPKKLLEVAGARHNDVMEDRDAFEQPYRFVLELPPPK